MAATLLALTTVGWLIHEGAGVVLNVDGSGSASVDLLARIIALVGAGTGLASLAVSFFGLDRRGLWRRRHASIQGLSASLREIDLQVDPTASPQAAQGLWTVGLQAALDDLINKCDDVPYRAFRRQLVVVHAEVVRVRGMQQPDPDKIQQGQGVTLTVDQRQSLARARSALDELERMRKKVAQKGVV